MGVLVVDLDLSGLPYRGGLRVGDVIFAVNGRQVNTHQDAIAETDAASVVEYQVCPRGRCEPPQGSVCVPAAQDALCRSAPSTASTARLKS